MVRKVAGFSFNDDTPRTVDVDVDVMLRKFRERLEEFAKYERLAEHLVRISKDDDLSAFKALDRGQVSDMSMDFWNPGNWFYDLREIVPFLTLELAKRKPKNMAALEKAHAFYGKSWRWRPKTLDPYGSTAAKYLSILKEVRGQLKACQEAAREPLAESSKPVTVGKFELFDSLGVEGSVLEGVKRALAEVGRNMTSISLGGFCYGKVTVVNSSKLHEGSAAFYVVNTDEIYVSPDLGSNDVRALCHEIGHRVYFQLNLKHQAETLYQATQEAGHWVTNYAKTNALENFAEVVSFAAVKKLDTNQKAQLQAAIPKIRLAREYGTIAERVASRFTLSRALYE